MKRQVSKSQSGMRSRSKRSKNEEQTVDVPSVDTDDPMDEVYFLETSGGVVIPTYAVGGMEPAL